MNKPVYIGLDIGKFHFSCSAPNAKVREFANDRAGIRDMLDSCLRLASAADLFFVMEATGGYSLATASVLLELAKTRVAIVPPICVTSFIRSRIKRIKNDRADAVAIRQFAEKMQPAPWVAPTELQRRLRDLLLVLDGVKQTIVRKKCLSEKLVCSPNPDAFALASHQRSLANEQEEKQRLQDEFEALIASDEVLARDSVSMLSIPGVGIAVRNVLLALCYRQLKELSQRKLLAHCGMCPQENQSGKSKGIARMNKAGDPRIRRVLFMAAQCTIRQKGIMHDYYQRLRKKGTSGKSALISVMRKLLYLIQAIVKSGTPFNKEQYAKAA